MVIKFKPLIFGLLLSLIAASAEAQGPAPPAPYSGPAVVEGYDTRALFQRWVMWVEGRKGDVLEAAAGEVGAPDGQRLRGTALMEARAFGDHGLALVADIAIFCPTASEYPDTEGCHSRMREITIPSSAAGYGTDDRLSDWASAHYDPVALVQALKAANVAPDAAPWRADLAPVFASLASPVEVLRSGTQVRTVDGRECPALVEALEAVEGRPLEWRIDLRGVANDAMIPAPRPHAAQWRYRLWFADEDHIEVEGGSSLASILSSVFQAGAACRRDLG